MSDLDALLAGIVADPHNTLRWLVVADWLDDHGQPERAELLRLHRELIRTCCEPDAHPERADWQRRAVELIDQGVKPCVPQHALVLPGGVPLMGHFIPPGSFLMGGTENIDEKPIHKVTITKGFFMGILPGYAGTVARGDGHRSERIQGGRTPGGVYQTGRGDCVLYEGVGNVAELGSFADGSRVGVRL